MVGFPEGYPQALWAGPRLRDAQSLGSRHLHLPASVQPRPHLEQRGRRTLGTAERTPPVDQRARTRSLQGNDIQKPGIGGLSRTCGKLSRRDRKNFTMFLGKLHYIFRKTSLCFWENFTMFSPDFETFCGRSGIPCAGERNQKRQPYFQNMTVSCMRLCSLQGLRPLRAA